MKDQKINYDAPERELDLLDLIEEVLRRIWFVLIFGVICCIAAGAYKYKADKAAAVEAAAAQGIEVTVSLSKKYLVVGFIGGVLVAAFLIILYVIIRGTVQTASELCSVYKLFVFGQIDVHEKNNSLVRLWRKIFNRQQKATPDEQLSLTEVSILAFCEKNNVSRVLFAGNDAGICDEPSVKALTDALIAEGIETEAVSSVLCDPSGLSNLTSYEQVILIEMLKKSHIIDITKTVMTCAYHGIDIAGVVAIN